MTRPLILAGKMQLRLCLRYCSMPLKILQGVRRCVFLRPVTLSSRHHFQRDFRWRPAVCRRWVEARVIRRARRHGLLHGVIDVEDDALRTVFAVRLLVLAFDDGN